MSELTRWEQETVVNYNNEEKIATVYTADPVVQRKLDKLCEKYPEHYKCTKEDSVAKWYSFEKKLVSFRPPVILTEEQIERNRQQLAKINEKNKK